jgi:hypothetical protein
MDTHVAMRLRTASELGEPRRLVLNIGCLNTAEVQQVVVNGVSYDVKPPHQRQGYYEVRFDDEAGVLLLVPTTPQRGDRFVRSWKSDPYFGDID